MKLRNLTRSSLLIGLAGFLLTGACGDDEPSDAADAGVNIDASIDDPDAAPPEPRVYALGTDSTSLGILSSVGVSDLEVTSDYVAGVASSDSVMRRFNDKIYIVNRFGFDNVTIVDPASAQLVEQISTGAGSNPQDVAVVGDSIYVCGFNSGSIIVLDESNPSATPLEIDISEYDSDTVPNCISIVEANGKVFATLGLLDDSFVSQGGKLIVIDPTDNTVTADLDLAFNNPFGLMFATEASGPFAGDLLVSTTEDFGTGNGCLERVSTGSTPASSGCLVNNAALGGYTTVAQEHEGAALVTVSTSFTTGKLVRVGADGTLNDTSITAEGQLVTDFVACPGGTIFTNDRNSGGLRVYDSEGTELGESALDIGLPPAFTNGLLCF